MRTMHLASDDGEGSHEGLLVVTERRVTSKDARSGTATDRGVADPVIEW